MGAEKEKINAAMGVKREEGVQMKNDLFKMKKSIGYTNEADIDNRIATIEFKLWTESVPLKEEKKYLLELQELKRNKPKVSQVHKMEENLTALREGASMKETVQEINGAMAKHREEKKVIQEKLSKLRDERKEKLGDVPQWIEERQQLSEQIGLKMKEKSAIRDELKQKEQEYYQYQKELRM